MIPRIRAKVVVLLTLQTVTVEGGAVVVLSVNGGAGQQHGGDAPFVLGVAAQIEAFAAV